MAKAATATAEPNRAGATPDGWWQRHVAAVCLSGWLGSVIIAGIIGYVATYPWATGVIDGQDGNPGPETWGITVAIGWGTIAGCTLLPWTWGMIERRGAPPPENDPNGEHKRIMAELRRERATIRTRNRAMIKRAIRDGIQLPSTTIALAKRLGVTVPASQSETRK